MATLFFEKNTSTRESLNQLARRLSDEDLEKQVGAGWTAAAIFAHLAFWDQRALELLIRWKHTGVNPSPVDSDAINDATKILCLAIPPRRAVQLFLTAANTIDAEIENLNPEMIKEIDFKSTHVRLDRAAHRKEHLRELEAVFY